MNDHFRPMRSEISPAGTENTAPAIPLSKRRRPMNSIGSPTARKYRFTRTRDVPWTVSIPMTWTMNSRAFLLKLRTANAYSARSPRAITATLYFGVREAHTPRRRALRELRDYDGRACCEYVF